MRQMPLIATIAGAAAIGFAGVSAVSSGALQAAAGYAGVGCNIKGNISLNTGERIHHLPGQPYYAETRISLEKGERYFCSEDEASEAGWRKSRV